MPKLFHLLLSGFLLMGQPKINIPDSKRAADVRNKVWPLLQKQLKDMELGDDQPVYIRIIKETKTLQLWILSGKAYRLFKSYDICSFSGGLGTKTLEWDTKSPEGFYNVTPDLLNPNSAYHLGINIGYPNKLERQLKYTGDAIMIHGDCVSIGCYAMSDPIIEEIYTIVYEAFLHGQKSIGICIVPFKMDDAHMKTYAGSPNIRFWQNIKTGFDIFQNTHVPPVVSVSNRQYVFKETAPAPR
jgi:murein L,D-transpeptidase YafK